MNEDLTKAKTLCNALHEDIQTHITEEYIMPAKVPHEPTVSVKECDDLVKEFDKQLMSDECRSLEWQVLQDVLGKIIKNKLALEQMFEKYQDIRFTKSYEQHFIQGINTFKQPCWNALASMCAELTMRKWH